ncbi:CAP domain-containing protein [Actinocrispum sp. NPDC049592]|uniref:CAP domain-containing protein n=1 Tax=Actinocrispum sp. NPDC049592 TaxID=3154835 RepID=UPI0034323722
MSETRPRRATIMASLTAVAAGAAIAGAATFFNDRDEAKALEVPLVTGYNGANNQARQAPETTATATALSGPAANGKTSTTTSTTSTTTSTTSTSTSTSTQAPPPSPAKSEQPPPPQTKQDAPSSPNPAFAAKVIELTNQFRASRCGPLKANAQLTKAAQDHASDMSNLDYFSHTGKDGRTFDKRIKEAGYASPGAENIAQGQSTPELVMQSWMASEGHRANIMNCDLNTIGVAVDMRGMYWVQDFGF